MVEGDVLTGQSLTMTPDAGQALVTAVFSDIDTVTDAGDFSATINWGDGTPATAEPYRAATARSR